VSYARDERTALCALLDQTGPDAPTLCEGWRTRHLAAHLVLRERRPGAAAGIPGGPLAAHTRRVTEALATGTPFPRLVEQIRTGPPVLSPFRLRSVDERVNLLEFFVHHEDVRRGNGEWEPRAMRPDLAGTLWQRLRLGRLLFRKAPVGVELVRDDLTAKPGQQQVRMTAKAKTPVVTVTGHPAELMLWALGRTSAARVRLDGTEDAVRRLAGTVLRP
jgi:uncharacterized protein (TIGR03085 family)